MVDLVHGASVVGEPCNKVALRVLEANAGIHKAVRRREIYQAVTISAANLPRICRVAVSTGPGLASSPPRQSACLLRELYRLCPEGHHKMRPSPPRGIGKHKPLHAPSHVRCLFEPHFKPDSLPQTVLTCSLPGYLWVRRWRTTSQGGDVGVLGVSAREHIGVWRCEIHQTVVVSVPRAQCSLAQDAPCRHVR